MIRTNVQPQSSRSGSVDLGPLVKVLTEELAIEHAKKGKDKIEAFRGFSFPEELNKLTGSKGKVPNQKLVEAIRAVPIVDNGLLSKGITINMKEHVLYIALKI